MKQTLLLLIVAIMIGCKNKKEPPPIWLNTMPTNYMKETAPYRDTSEAAVLTMNKRKEFYWKHVYMARYYNGYMYTLENVLNLNKKPINIQVFETHYKQR